MAKTLPGTVVWVWSKDELQPLGAGRRRVRYVTHPRRKKYLKVYRLLDTSNPVVISETRFNELIVDGS